MQQFGDVFEIDTATFVEHDRKRIPGAGDDRRNRWRDYPFGEDRTGLCRVGIEVVVLDGRDQPAIGIVPERRQVRLAVGLTDLTGLFVLADRDGSMIDRAEFPNKGPPGDAQPDLKIPPGTILFLGFQHLANGIADREQFADNAGMLFRNAVAAATLAYADRHGGAVDQLHEGILAVEEKAAFADFGIIGLQVDDLGEFFFQIEINDTRLAIIEMFGKQRDGVLQQTLKVLAGTRLAGIGLAKGPGGQGMVAEHEDGMSGKPAIDADRALIGGGGPDLVDVKPGDIAFGLSGLAFAEEQDVDHDIGPGICAKRAFRQANGGDKVGRFRDMLTGRRIGLVHRTVGGDESGESAWLQQIDRPCNEVIMQSETQAAIVAVGAHRSIRKRRVADGKIVDHPKIGAGEIAIDDPRLRLKEADDPGGDRIEFDAGDIAGGAECLRHQGRE